MPPLQESLKIEFLEENMTPQKLDLQFESKILQKRVTGAAWS
jgi:hypothetical protein